ncbi:hypothetical protein [Parachlamydia sp. AcF125]|uniref:hypothetical protein n=1 Tax=Parachlamydia sp. AcF125 TaxID=2795736 RepID=UPI001BC9B878|nr:hypothetical protein [Parachlamydia sp. AcF125]MBS4167716.1 hypothetical protein [Parachlamydia sp. AcF125]
MGTVFSALLSLLLWLHPVPLEGRESEWLLASITGAVALIFLLIFFLLLSMAWTPLGRAEENFTWRILELYQKDTSNFLVTGWVVFFLIASLAGVLNLTWLHQITSEYTVAIWVLLFGMTVDACLFKVKKIYSYLTPSGVIQMFANQAKKSIQDEKELELCHWIEALSEVAFKSLESFSTSICHDSIYEMQRTIRFFLESSKSISHHSQDSQSLEMGIKDKVGYTLFYVFQRLELIHEKAIQSKLEMTSEQILSALGKITLDGAKYDLSIVSYPVHYLGKLALRSQQAGMEDIGNKASLILLEVTKSIVAQLDLSYQELQEPFLVIINNLEKIAKEIFRQNKAVNLKLVAQPFKDLKEFLGKNPKTAHHQDTPVLIGALDRIIDEFNTLEVVLKTMPPISEFTQSSLSTESGSGQ